MFLLFWTFYGSNNNFWEHLTYEDTKIEKNQSHVGDWAHENYRSYQSKHKVSKFLFMVFLCKILDQLITGTIKIENFWRYAAFPGSSSAHESNSPIRVGYMWVSIDSIWNRFCYSAILMAAIKIFENF